MSKMYNDARGFEFVTSDKIPIKIRCKNEQLNENSHIQFPVHKKMRKSCSCCKLAVIPTHMYHVRVHAPSVHQHIKVKLRCAYRTDQSGARTCQCVVDGGPTLQHRMKYEHFAGYEQENQFPIYIGQFDCTKLKLKYVNKCCIKQFCSYLIILT